MRKTGQAIAGFEDEEDHKSLKSGDCGIWKRKGSKFFHSTSRKKNQAPPGHYCGAMRHPSNVCCSELYNGKLQLLGANTVIYFFQIEN